MNNRIENNKRIAKNTAMLYMRMLLSMAVSFYTSRIVLNILGVDDFGIYNLVGGIVVLFSFLNNAMASSTQRFLNFELGRENLDEVKRIFSMSLTTHLSIAFVVLVLSETVGLWLLNAHMNLPADRMNAANWVYQLSVLSCCIQIMRIPYQSSIIAYERMSFYAYISIVEVLLKLLIVIFLFFGDFDKLIYYSILSTVVVTLVSYIYKIYCIKAFSTCSYSFFWDIKLYRMLVGFSGWNLFGSVANVGVQQGGNILLNIFYGVTVNAAVGVANQASMAIYGFVSNFQIAFNPSIIKSYAIGDRDYFMDLIFKASKYSYFLLFMLSLPILICCGFVMEVWLGIVPSYTVSFCRLMLLFMLVDSAAAPLWTSVQATGKIRNYQIMIGCLVLTNLPLAYTALCLGMSPVCVFVIRLLVNIIVFTVRLIYLCFKIDLPILKYTIQVLMKILFVTILSVPLPWVVNYYYHGWLGLILTSLIAFLCTSLSVWFVGLKQGERKALVRTILRK